MGTDTPPIACPACHTGRLVVRTNRQNDSQFLACDQYPDCKHTEPMREIYRMRAMGHPELPLFEDQEVQ